MTRSKQSVGERQEVSNEFCLREIFEFQNRLHVDPDAISDEELIAEYGDDFDIEELRNTFRKYTFNRPPKNPRASARAKLRRRLLWLEQSLGEVEVAVDAVLNAPGRTNKRTELEDLQGAIKNFREAVTLPSRSEPQGDGTDIFERILGLPSQDQTDANRAEASSCR